MKRTFTLLACVAMGCTVAAQQHSFPIARADSISIRVHPSFDDVGKFHRFLFGENYRKDWATEVRLPWIRVSEFMGGLKALELGGGFQTQSLRMVDSLGREWTLRSVEKSPEKILPDQIRETFISDWVKDAMSAQHPFSALIVPPIAMAANVAHANPMIGVVAHDEALGEYNELFAHKVCLIEEREPVGESINTTKLINALLKNNRNTVDYPNFLRARMVDLLVGDWDRHADQWRWTKGNDGDKQAYFPVPRDRDQALYINKGLLPYVVSRSWVAPNLQGFGAEVADVRYSLWKTMFLNRFSGFAISHEKWNQTVNGFVAAITDSVLEESLKRLPREIYALRHDQWLAQLRQRRDQIPKEMEKFYRFEKKVVDIHLSDQNEYLTIKGQPDRTLNVTIKNITKEGLIGNKVLADASFDPEVTKEIRIYLSAGDDRVVIDNSTSPIKLRLIDSLGKKEYEVIESMRKTRVYDRLGNLTIKGKQDRIIKKFSLDSANTSYLPVNLYHVLMPLAGLTVNPDEGVLLGLGFRYTRQEGFRTRPYKHIQQLVLSHSFTTEAFRASYNGTWKNVFSNWDFLIAADAQSPTRMNYFGRGNETTLDKLDGYQAFHRTRFQLYTLDHALRYSVNGKQSIKIGTSIQYYRLDAGINHDRILAYPNLIGTYDRYSVNQSKLQMGLVLEFNNDNRNNRILPDGGYYFRSKLQGFRGLNKGIQDYMQLLSSFTFYERLFDSGIVLSNRTGGGITIGNTPFYQSLFLGGQDNLLGYHQFRFAGQHLVYNNLEMRVKVADLLNHIIPGELGMMGVFDTGRVWEKGEKSNNWHYGVGGGVYFVPGGYTSIQLMAGYSREGWYPFLSTSFRL